MIQETLMFCNDILHAHLRPWVFGFETETNFEKLRETIIPEKLDFTTTFEVSFDQGANPKQVFYSILIETGSNHFLNEVHEGCSKVDSEEGKSFFINGMYAIVVRTLNDCFQVLQIRNANEVSEPDEAFISALLKHHLMWVFLEVQEKYRNYIEEPYLRSDEAYPIFFNEEEPYPNIIHDAIHSFKLVFPETEDKLDKEERTEFSPIQKDFRPIDQTLLTYEQLIKNPEFFGKAEEQLYQEGIIDHDYNFQNQYGQKQYLAAVCHQWINKGYFQFRVFPENSEVKPADIISFLHYRYNTDFNKQFRIWSNKPQNLQEFINRKYWLENMISC